MIYNKDQEDAPSTPKLYRPQEDISVGFDDATQRDGTSLTPIEICYAELYRIRCRMTRGVRGRGAAALEFPP